MTGTEAEHEAETSLIRLFNDAVKTVLNLPYDYGNKKHYTDMAVHIADKIIALDQGVAPLEVGTGLVTLFNNAVIIAKKLPYNYGLKTDYQRRAMKLAEKIVSLKQDAPSQQANDGLVDLLNDAVDTVKSIPASQGYKTQYEHMALEISDKIVALKASPAPKVKATNPGR